MDRNAWISRAVTMLRAAADGSRLNSLEHIRETNGLTAATLAERLGSGASFAGYQVHALHVAGLLDRTQVQPGNAPFFYTVNDVGAAVLKAAEAVRIRAEQEADAC